VSEIIILIFLWIGASLSIYAELLLMHSLKTV